MDSTAVTADTDNHPNGLGEVSKGVSDANDIIWQVAVPKYEPAVADQIVWWHCELM
jgi:hypothetical protein